MLRTKKSSFAIASFEKIRVLALSSSFLLVIFAVLTLLPLTTASDTTATIDSEMYSLTVNATDANLDVNPNGNITIGKSTITSKTESPAGYKLYLSATGNSNTIYLNNDSNNTANNKKFISNGTYASPSALTTTSEASWGYAIAGLNNFDASYNISNPSQSAKFAAVPTAEAPQLIYHHYGSAPAGVDLDVYFGAKAKSDTTPGVYTTDIKISSISDMTSEALGEATFAPNRLEEGYAATTATVTTSLSSSIDYDASSITTTIYNKTCANTVITNKSPLTYTCTIPAGLAKGSYDVNISISKLGKSYFVEDGLAIVAKTAKAILSANGNLNFVYDVNEYKTGNTYTDNLGTTTIDEVYNVPLNSQSNSDLAWLDWKVRDNIKTANFDSSFYGFQPKSTAYWLYGCNYLYTVTNAQNLNTSTVTNMSYMFAYSGGRADDVEIDNYINGLEEWDTSKVTDMSYMFRGTGFNASWNMDLSGWDTSSVTDVTEMFSEAGYLAKTWNVNLSNWDLSHVTSTSYMFDRTALATETFSMNLTGWKTGSVTDMSWMFSETGEESDSYTLIGLDGWDTSSVTTMRQQFAYTGLLADYWSIGDLSAWDTSSVVNMEQTFEHAGNDATTWSVGDLSDWDTSSVTSMYYMFSNAGSNASTWYVGDISSWNTGNVTEMRSMFANVGENADFHLDLSDWNVGKVTNHTGFNGGVEEKIISPWDPKTAKAILGANGNLNFVYTARNYAVGDTYTDNLGSTTISAVYGVPTNATSDSDIAWSYNGNIISANFDPSFNNFHPTSTAYWFYINRELSTVTNAQNLDTSSVTNMSSMFTGAISLATIDLSTWDTSSVTNMSNMFASAGSEGTAWTIDPSAWDTSSVTDMSGMFTHAGPSARNVAFTMDLSGWDTSSVTNMSHMFYEAGYNTITWSVDLSAWDTSSVTDMSSMFETTGCDGNYCSGATWYVGDLGNWNTSSVTSMENMFSGAGTGTTTWTTGDLNNWNTSSVTNMSHMFQGAGRNATTFSLDLSTWNTSSVTNMSYMFAGAGYNATTFSLDLSTWDTSSVTSMSSMFASAGKNATTFSLDLSTWDTSPVTSMNDMFYSAGYSATTWHIDGISNWNTRSVKTMSSMFYNAGYNADYYLDLSGWNVGKVTDHSNFDKGVESKILSPWDVTAKAILGANGNLNFVYDPNKYVAGNTYTDNLGSTTISAVYNVPTNATSYSNIAWRNNNYDITSANFDPSFKKFHPTSTAFWFYDDGYLSTITNAQNLDTSSVTNMYGMFSRAGAGATTFSLDLSTWDTSSVTNMSEMFSYAGCNATTWSVGDLSTWDTSSVTDMSEMFSYAGYSANYYMDLSGWNVGKVTNHTKFDEAVGSKILSPWD